MACSMSGLLLQLSSAMLKAMLDCCQLLHVTASLQ